MEQQLVTLFKTYTEMDTPPVLQLFDINNKVVGALYMKNLKYKNMVVSETNNSEKYYLYVDGVGIYFSFFQKLSI